LAVLKLAILVSGVLALAKLGFLDSITGGYDTGRLGELIPIIKNNVPEPAGSPTGIIHKKVD
jgi:hypothetical protein